MTTGVTTVKKIIEGGLGLAFFEGKTVFIPFTAPGDRVEFSVEKDSGNILFSRAENILEPSPMRIDPACPNFTRCPGCDFLHLDYNDEAKTKRGMTAETFSRIGKSEIDFEMIPSPGRFGYRNSITFEFDEEGRPGLRNPESDELVPFPEGGCPLLSENTRSAVQELTGRSCRTPAPALAVTDKFGISRIWGVNGSIEMPDLVLEAGGNLFPVRPRPPILDNTYLRERFLETMVSMQETPEGRLVELFCGEGMLSLAFADSGIRVLGIDEDRIRIEDASAAARLNEIEGAEFIQGRMEKVLRDVRGVNSLVVSSPQGGISRPVLKWILKQSPFEITVNSSDAATLARDLRRLKDNGYRLDRSCIIDLYPGKSSSRIVINLKNNPES